VVETPALQAAGPSLVEAAMSRWFHLSSRFQQHVSNAAKAGQSLPEPGSANWKSLRPVRRPMPDLMCRAVFSCSTGISLLFEQKLLYMVFLVN
jgi:hypothetical protein